MAKFVIGIGGTGMRCLESFIHLCAIGMFDDEDIHILALDTDAKNGNFDRVKKLVECYRTISSDEGGENEGGKNTFFSAKIHSYEFGPIYDSATFDNIADYSSASGKAMGNGSYKESDICDLFLTKKVRTMDLNHGYRAQTQMGAMLMYHAIIEAAYNYNAQRNGLNSKNEKSLASFVNALATGNEHKVFIFGSVFGGTGASSIPIIPRALNKAAQIIEPNGESIDIIKSNFFSASLLTNYFSFDPPRKNDNEVVATSDKFTLNSQAALYFYTQDQTIAKCYNRMYLIGRDEMRNIATADSSDTGGAKQKNPVDYIELMCATAAYDFFKNNDEKDDRNNNRVVPVFCRKIESKEYSDFLTPLCFFDDENTAKSFEKKLGMLTAFAFLNTKDFVSQMQNEGYSIQTPKKEALKDYFDFFYNLSEKDGWLYQINKSANDGHCGNFIFKKDVYNFSDARKFKYNENLFAMDFNSFSAGFLKSDPFNVVKQTFLECRKGGEGDNNLLSLISGVYQTFNTLYK